MMHVLFDQNNYDTIQSISSRIDWNSFMDSLEQNQLLLRLTTKLLDMGLVVEHDIDNLISFSKHMNTSKEMLLFMEKIQQDLRCIGLDEYVFFKTLEHYPDLGNDIDILTPGKGIIQIMNVFSGKYGATRSIVEKLTGKFIINLQNLCFLEFYSSLSNFGEKYLSEDSIVKRSKLIEINGFKFKVPSNEDAFLIIIIHSMYRHGGILKLSEFYQAVLILGSNSIDWNYLYNMCHTWGITAGLFCFLNIISSVYSDSKLLACLPDLRQINFPNCKKYVVRKFPFHVSFSTIIQLFLFKSIHDLRNKRIKSAFKTSLSCLYKMFERIIFYR